MIVWSDGGATDKAPREYGLLHVVRLKSKRFVSLAYTVYDHISYWKLFALVV